MNIVGRYSQYWGDLELEGADTDLRALADMVEKGSCKAELLLSEASEVHHRPYRVRQIVLADDMGPVRIRREGDILHITGAPEFRAILAESIRSVADAGPTNTGVRRHSHIEYIEPHEWISPSSEPLVVSLRT